MSQQQREQLDQMVRSSGMDMGGDVADQRRIFGQMMAATPLPDDVTKDDGTLGGVPVVSIATSTSTTSGPHVLFYLHGGAYAIGTADQSVGLASDLARRTHLRAVSVNYRLAPEHPYPAALDDVLSAYAGLLDQTPATQVAITGESAGGGLVMATLLAARSRGLDLPAAAFVMSPWADLTLSGATVTSKAALDPALSPAGMRTRAADYAGGSDPSDPLLSPIFGDLRGLPPLLIQAGSHEILLDDAVRLAARAAEDDVQVTLQITPGVPHVFQGFAAMLDEGGAALDEAARFLRQHLPH